MKKIVIQCAGTKNPCGSFNYQNGELIKFVAHPELCKPISSIKFQKPDDCDQAGVTWRNKLVEYNSIHYEVNPLKLLKAYQLYKKSIYTELVEHFGIENVYILSAGWGLVRADFLLPDYDITFSASAERSKRRLKSEQYQDLALMSTNKGDEIVFLGGKDYQHLFVKLTSHLPARKVIVYNALKQPKFKNVEYVIYNVKQKTNWHYSCAKEIINGDFEIFVELRE